MPYASFSGRAEWGPPQPTRVNDARYSSIEIAWRASRTLSLRVLSSKLIRPNQIVSVRQGRFGSARGANFTCCVTYQTNAMTKTAARTATNHGHHRDGSKWMKSAVRASAPETPGPAKMPMDG